MKCFTFLALAIFNAVFLCEAATSLLKCAADNCLRAMTHTPDVASSLCSAVMATSITTITPTVTVSYTYTITASSVSIPTKAAEIFPSHISSQCELAKITTSLPARISSVCSCMSITQVEYTATSTVIAPAAATVTVDAPTICDTEPGHVGWAGDYDANGTYFSMQCGYQPVLYFVASTTNDVTHFGQCISTCQSEITGCIAVLFTPTGSNGDNYCVYISDLPPGGAHLAPGTYFAFIYT